MISGLHMPQTLSDHGNPTLAESFLCSPENPSHFSEKIALVTLRDFLKRFFLFRSVIGFESLFP